MNVQSPAIILKTQKYKEFDEIIVAFTRNYGKIRMFARSSKRMKSPLLSGTQLFAHSDLTMDLRGSGNRLFEAKVIKSFYEISYDLSKYYLASYFCEAIDRYHVENISDSRFFDRTVSIFNALLKSERLKLIRIIFELFLIESIGLRPNTESCKICGNKNADEFSEFDMADGSVICKKCHIQKDSVVKIDKNMIRFFSFVYKFSINMDRLLAIKITDKLLEKSDDFISSYIIYHLGRIDLKSYEIVKEEEKRNDNFRND